jgi:hypothetical protein
MLGRFMRAMVGGFPLKFIAHSEAVAIGRISKLAVDHLVLSVGPKRSITIPFDDLHRVERLDGRRFWPRPEAEEAA